ncbi:MAG: trehalose-phosphatase [Hyphomicrobiaceae bacterium]
MLPPLPPVGEVALFLDFDGTLAEFADHPASVSVPEELIATLAQLHQATHGALAIVTGRDIREIDDFLAPLVLPVAGVHGLVRRTYDGQLHLTDVDDIALATIAGRLDNFVDGQDGLIVERKSRSVALHYRRAPAAADACLSALTDALHDLDDFEVQVGKLVVEARAIGHDKGSAIATFLAEPPFANRRPVFAGDDVTDEDGFRYLNECATAQAITIKVGAGASEARYRVRSVEALRGWLQALNDSGTHS